MSDIVNDKYKLSCGIVITNEEIKKYSGTLNYIQAPIHDITTYRIDKECWSVIFTTLSIAQFKQLIKQVHTTGLVLVENIINFDNTVEKEWGMDIRRVSVSDFIGLAVCVGVEHD